MITWKNFEIESTIIELKNEIKRSVAIMQKWLEKTSKLTPRSDKKLPHSGGINNSGGTDFGTFNKI